MFTQGRIHQECGSPLKKTIIIGKFKIQYYFESALDIAIYIYSGFLHSAENTAPLSAGPLANARSTKGPSSKASLYSQWSDRSTVVPNSRIGDTALTLAGLT